MKFTENTTCPHCGGDVTPHEAGGKIIYWCDVCGANDKDNPPNVTVEFTEKK